MKFIHITTMTLLETSIMREQIKKNQWEDCNQLLNKSLGNNPQMKECKKKHLI